MGLTGGAGIYVSCIIGFPNLLHRRRTKFANLSNDMELLGRGRVVANMEDGVPLVLLLPDPLGRDVLCQYGDN